MSQEKSTVRCECNPSRGFHCSKCWPHWLDPIIKEQADHYGMSVKKHGQLMHDAAQFDEDNPQL